MVGVRYESTYTYLYRLQSVDCSSRCGAVGSNCSACVRVFICSHTYIQTYPTIQLVSFCQDKWAMSHVRPDLKCHKLKQLFFYFLPFVLCQCRGLVFGVAIFGATDIKYSLAAPGQARPETRHGLVDQILKLTNNDVELAPILMCVERDETLKISHAMRNRERIRIY